eukprot:408703-Amphidinium_carterae.1
MPPRFGLGSRHPSTVGARAIPPEMTEATDKTMDEMEKGPPQESSEEKGSKGSTCGALFSLILSVPSLVGT